MHRYGLIGNPLGHSFSKDHFTRKFKQLGLADHRYELYPIASIDELPALLRDPELHGLNVTVPYKRSAIPFLTAMDPLAAAVGAVNTLARGTIGWTGHNTDVFGFRQLLTPVLPLLQTPGSDVRPRALVLGSGGASRAVAYVLRDLGIRFRVVSRSRDQGDLTWDMVDRTVLSVCRLLINTTPLGMHPDVATYPPLPYASLSPRHVLIDLVYNPERTQFLELGAAQGAHTVGGMGMLIAQAEESWRVWQQA